MTDPVKFPAHTPLEVSRVQLTRLGLWLRNFLPASVRIGYAEALRMSLGVVLGLLVTAFLSRWWGGAAPEMWMVSSLGASAVLLFGMPASPLAQPWPVLGGTVVSALVGAAAQVVIADPAVACAVAVGVSIMLMVPLRCMHPPGAGIAAYVVLDHINGVQLVAFPIMFNVVVLLGCAVVYNTLTGKRYPHPQHSLQKATAQPEQGLLSSQDLDAALKHYNQVLDVSRADLEGLMHLAGRLAFQRNFGNKRCADIMSEPVFAVEPTASIKEAWSLMQQKRVKALPVVDAQSVVIGMVGIADFMDQAAPEPQGLVRRLRRIVLGAGGEALGKVQDVMEAAPATVRADCLLLDLVPQFSGGGCHHMPVVDGAGKLLGIVTQTDLIRALSAAISLPAKD
ncbi:MAG: HPP family protein [Comamonas sp.]|nr:HPP family protein [Candidatus Comamonas equi]